MSGAINGIANTANQGTNTLRSLWNLTRGTVAVLAVSTAVAVATGGVSLTADAAAAAGNAVAGTTGQINVSPMDMVSMTVQGLAHNFSGISDILAGFIPD